MRNTKSKHFVKAELKENTSFKSVSSDFERDEDDPLSIRSLSITFLGIIIALITFLLPSISVLLVKPSSLGNEVNLNHSIKKDGS